MKYFYKLDENGILVESVAFTGLDSSILLSQGFIETNEDMQKFIGAPYDVNLGVQGAIEGDAAIARVKEKRANLLQTYVDPIVTNALRWESLTVNDKSILENYRLALLNITTDHPNVSYSWNAITEEWDEGNIVWPTWVELNGSTETTVPDKVTMRQARLALLEIQLLDAVEAAIVSGTQEDQIEWEYATDVFRDSLLVNNLGPAMGLTEQELDNLFLLARTK